jgi:nucleotide-binding universal stress UspA family protein
MTSNVFSPATHAFAAPAEAATVAGPVLVATDGSDAADPAMDAAAMIARATGATIEVVSVVEPLPPVVGGELAKSLVQAAEAEERSRAQRVERQARARLGDVSPRLHVLHGRPAIAVPHVARERNAALIVAAYGKHGLVQRILGTETPLRIARTADVPVLCVPPGFARLPRVVVVAVDFGVDCARAAAAARPLLSSATQVLLVHAKPEGRLDAPASLAEEWERAYERELQDVFARIGEILALPPDVSVTTVVQRGAPGRVILDYCESVHAELLVAGHGHRGRLDRLLAGSVASQLFRGAQCALLLAPDVRPAPRVPASREHLSTETYTERARWLGELVRFTDRNAGRMATLEVDDARLGSQVVAHGLPFTGVDYDWRDDAIEVILGGGSADAARCNHRVRDPVSIAVMRGADGGDRALRIERLAGQLLLVLAESAP